MSDKRRVFIKTVGATSAVLLSGCSSDDGEVQDSDDDGVVDSQDYAPGDDNVQSRSDVSESTQNDQNSQDTQQDSQENTVSTEPELIATSFPKPEGVSTDSTSTSGRTYNFSVTIQNTGDAGNIIITLQWLNDEGKVINSDVESIKRYYNAGERREETVTAERPDNIPRFRLNFVAESITATVRNSGEAGRVDVELYRPFVDSSAIIASSTVRMEAGETRDVEIGLEGRSSLSISDDAEVRAVDAE